MTAMHELQSIYMNRPHCIASGTTTAQLFLKFLTDLTDRNTMLLIDRPRGRLDPVLTRLLTSGSIG